MKPEDIYKGQLNTERIAAYQKLADLYYISDTTIGSIFDKGAEWGISVSNCNADCDNFKPRPLPDRAQCTPDVCDHDVKWRTYYDGGSSWCNKCWSYIFLSQKPVNKKKESFFQRFFQKWL